MKSKKKGLLVEKTFATKDYLPMMPFGRSIDRRNKATIQAKKAISNCRNGKLYFLGKFLYFNEFSPVGMRLISLIG
jgi:hypothetical protein